MRSWMGQLLAGLASALVTLSAWGDGPAGAGTILVAPQLAVASTGPVTATFLGASSSFSFSGPRLWDWTAPEGPFSFTAYGFGFTSATTPGTQSSTPVSLSAGTNVTLATFFPVAINDGLQSTTRVAGPIDIPRDLGGSAVFQNAGVVQTGRDTVLVGFFPAVLDDSFSPQPFPSRFADFAVRISVSNLCVRF